MASQNRKLTRVIKGAIKSLKRGEIPYPPEPTRLSAEDSRQFIEELKERRRRLQADMNRLDSRAASRRDYKRLLRIDHEIQHLDQFFKDVGGSD
jgi:hypothetical protein